MATIGFDEILDRVAVEAGRAAFEIPDGWGQGRATLGALVAALSLRAMRSVAAGGEAQDGIEPRPPRSLLCSFTAPVEPGGVAIEVARLRRGGSVTHAEARVLQGGEVACVVLASFGAGRDSTLAVDSQPRPDAPGPDGLDELPFLPGVTPEFTRQVAYRWALGAPVFSGRGRREMGGWCRLRDGRGAATEERLLALVDAWPAAVLSRIDRPAPASSLTWAIEFVQPIAAPAPSLAGETADEAGMRGVAVSTTDDWWFYRSQTESSAGGYAHESAALWDPAGRLVAVSRQVVAVFA